eukprot:364615-Chlamydomonas_euryale.AAC.31
MPICCAHGCTQVVQDFIKPATKHTGKCLVETVAAMIMEKNMGEEMKLAAHDPSKSQMNKGAFEEVRCGWA